MPRIARVVASGHPHHITQRGNYKQTIFSCDADREKYISLLQNEIENYGVSILAYCLMPNHVHFIAVPENDDSLAKAFKYAHMKYSQYYNKKNRAQGHLFQGRFFSSIMDEPHTLACARYIERNPVRANLARAPHHWQWSSARVHSGIDRKDKFEAIKLFDYISMEQEEWKKFAEMPDDLNEIEQIRKQTRNGRPLGGTSLIEQLEAKLKRFLKPGPRGRPWKKAVK